MLTGAVAAGRSRLRRIGGDRRGVAAVEFALILPLLVLLLGGAVELGGAFTAGVRATKVAETIGQVVAQSQSRLETAELAAIIKSAALVDPDIVDYARVSGKSLESAADITVSSVAFKERSGSCTVTCDYDAYVVFSEALSGPKRPCGMLTRGSGDSPSTLPASVYSANALVVVDVEIFYRPLLTSILGSEISFKRSLHLRPRYLAELTYKRNCPGFPTT